MYGRADIFRKLETYGPIVNHALVAVNTVGGSELERAINALLQVPDSIVSTPGFPYAGFEKLDLSAYDQAREIVRQEREEAGKSRVAQSIHAADFSSEALRGVLDIIRDVRIALEAKNNTRFVKREPTPLLQFKSTEELALEAKDQLQKAAQSFAELKDLPKRLADPLQVLRDPKVKGEEAIRAYKMILDALDPFLQSSPPRTNRGAIALTSRQDRILCETSMASVVGNFKLAQGLDSDLAGVRFISGVSAFLSELRHKGEEASIEEKIGLRIAYALLEAGVRVRGSYQSLGISGFRDIHAYLFNTDPGEGHIRVSCTDLNLMRGTAIHVEHIDRDKEFNKEKVEAYRLPALIHAARVRLHVGADAPCTCYIGRPVFESGTFKLDLLKSAHMTASACTAMFMNGYADAKIAIERMTSTESVSFVTDPALKDGACKAEETDFCDAGLNQCLA